MLLAIDACDWLLSRWMIEFTEILEFAFPPLGWPTLCRRYWQRTEKLLRKARIALTPRSWLLKRVLSNGSIVYGRNRAGHGVRGVYLEGDGIEPELQQLENLLANDAVFVDVGANTGIFSLKAAKYLGGAGVVIAIEPSLDMLSMLAYNIKANSLTNVRVRNLCISDRTGEQVLWMNHNKPVAFSLLKTANDASSTSVLAVTLDDLCMWEGLTRLDYLKIDVVGAEQKVLAGAEKTISRFLPVIQVPIPVGRAPANLPNYSTYQLLNAPKLNVVYIPTGDKRAVRFRELGWQMI
jgi:FkbM family methyltransferase